MFDSNIAYRETMWASLQATVCKHPLRTALEKGSQCLSYEQLGTHVDIATRILNTFHTSRQERIVIVAEKTPEIVTVILAALHLRIVLVVVNPLLKPAQIHHIIKDSGATLLLCTSRKAHQLYPDIACPTVPENIVLLQGSENTILPTIEGAPSGLTASLMENSNAELYVWQDLVDSVVQDVNPDPIDHPVSTDLALILYTSGSTGKPKGVMLNHANLYYGALSVSTYLKNDKNDRILALMPLSFDYGLSQLTTTILIGSTLVLYDYVLPRGFVKTVVDQKITGIPGVPHLWDQLAKVEWPNNTSVRYITSTGGRFQESTINALQNVLPSTTIYSMYGFTEAFRATFLPPDQLEKRPESIGKSVPFAKVLVVDEQGREVAAGEYGELIQSGPLVSQGYWNDEDGTRNKIRRCEYNKTESDLFAWSGDLAYRDSDGYIYFVSRKDDLVKLNGYRVYLSEIEMSLIDCPLIDEVCVLSTPDKRFGHTANAFVVLNSKADAQVLTQWCNSVLPSFMIPTSWTILDMLPTTPNNKVDRHALFALLPKET